MDVIESKTLPHGRFTIRIDVVPDSVATPFDADCYSDADIERWKNDEWHYVGIVYTAMIDGIELGESSIWGTEYDLVDSPDFISDWIAEDYYHPDLLSEAISEARAAIASLTA